MRTNPLLLQLLRAAGLGCLLAFATLLALTFPPAKVLAALPLVWGLGLLALILTNRLTPVAAELLRGATHATVFTAAAGLALKLAAPSLLHTILSNLHGVDPVLLTVGRLSLMAGAVNFFAGPYPTRASRKGATPAAPVVAAEVRA